MSKVKFSRTVDSVYVHALDTDTSIMFTGSVIEDYDPVIVESVIEWLVSQGALEVDNLDYLIENNDQVVFERLYNLMLRTQLADLQADNQDSCLNMLATDQQPEFIEINLRFDAILNRLCLVDPEMVTNYNTSLVDSDTIEKLKQLSTIGRFRIPNNEYKINVIRCCIFSKGVIQFLFNCYEKANKRTGLVGDKPVIETLSLLHFKYKNNTLIISEQPLEVSRNHIRYIHYLKRNEIAQWCEDNSPLYIKNTDAINLMNCQEWSDDYCLSFLADVKKDYKKPMPKQNDEYAIVEPVSTYRMTFYYNGQSYSYEHYEPFYFVRKCEPTEQYPLGFEPVIGKHHNAVALPTNGDKYVMLAPCTVEEIKPLWTIQRDHHDYQLRYENSCMMDFRADSPCVNLVNWFLETQPKITDQQCDIMFDCSDSLHVLSLFKAMYK